MFTLAVSTGALATMVGGAIAGKVINKVDNQKERQFQIDKLKEQNRDYEERMKITAKNEREIQ